MSAGAAGAARRTLHPFCLARALFDSSYLSRQTARPCTFPREPPKHWQNPWTPHYQQRQQMQVRRKTKFVASAVHATTSHLPLMAHACFGIRWPVLSISIPMALLLACLPTCLPTCLLACPLACPLACLLACLPHLQLAVAISCPLGLLACLLACLLAHLPLAHVVSPQQGPWGPMVGPTRGWEQALAHGCRNKPPLLLLLPPLLQPCGSSTVPTLCLPTWHPIEYSLSAFAAQGSVLHHPSPLHSSREMFAWGELGGPPCANGCGIPSTIVMDGYSVMNGYRPICSVCMAKNSNAFLSNALRLALPEVTGPARLVIVEMLRGDGYGDLCECSQCHRKWFHRGWVCPRRWNRYWAMYAPWPWQIHRR